MSLRVYNTLTQKKELFEPLKPGKVTLYVCGPTVYKPPHMGHMVGPIVFDAIKRYLSYKGFEVTWLVNITDVDDKIIQEARETNQLPRQVAERCGELYLECLRKIGIDTIDRFPKASEHIGDMIAMIQKLIEKNNAYVSGGNVWFSVKSCSDYGKLSNRHLEEQEAGTRDLEGAGKRHPADFALWKTVPKDEISWDSPWGPGRPGWHIECSAMSTKYLGDSIDLHGGGDDLKFPHHENELAQAECCTGKPFVKYWLHNGLTRIKTKMAGHEVWEKQSKSLGNVVDAKTFLEENGPDLMRYLILSTHYRRPIDFSEEVIASTRKGLAVFQRLLERVATIGGEKISDASVDLEHQASQLMETNCSTFVKTILAFKMKFLEAMDDDFNTAGAIAAMHEMAGAVNSFIEAQNLERQRNPEMVSAIVGATTTLRKLGTILGLFRVESASRPAKDDLSDKLMQLIIKLRQQARADKNFALADAIRKGLTEIGVTLEDKVEGTLWRRG